VHAGCAPADVGICDPANQIADLAILPWPTGTALPGEASPVRGEALSMPARNVSGLTMTRVSFRSRQDLDRITLKARSSFRIQGRGRCRPRTASC